MLWPGVGSKTASSLGAHHKRNSGPYGLTIRERTKYNTPNQSNTLLRKGLLVIVNRGRSRTDANLILTYRFRLVHRRIGACNQLLR
jgi:hypothetical protein